MMEEMYFNGHTCSLFFYVIIRKNDKQISLMPQKTVITCNTSTVNRIIIV